MQTVVCDFYETIFAYIFHSDFYCLLWTEKHIPKLKPSFSGQTKDTLVLNHQRLVRTLRDNKLQSLVMLSGDTILKDVGYYSEVEFIDINADGYKDIRAFVVSNTPNQCENYLFDKKKKTFRFLRNCDIDIRLIKETNYYYSYNREGCADMNWESYLSSIENFKLMPVRLEEL